MSAEHGLMGPSRDARIGTTIQDRYRIVRKLGEGGMGAVYEGEHVVIRRRLAIKFLHPQFASNAEIVGRFHREALAATSIGHEHIIEVIDMGRVADDGAVFMALEYLDGQNLRTLIENTAPLSLGRMTHIALQICDAIGAAHAKGIVHRDLKPENVFLITRGGDPDFVKVLDFGIAKMLDGDGIGLATRTGASMGTPYYMAPEQTRGAKDVDQRTDLYALGVILFQGLTGRLPFQAETYPMLVVQINSEAPPPLRSLRPDLPPAVEAVVSRLLAKSPGERYRDAAAVREALVPFAGDRSPAPPRDVGIALDATVATDPSAASRPSVTGPLQSGGPSGLMTSTVAPRVATIPSETQAPRGGSRTPLVAAVVALSALAGIGITWKLTRGPQVAPQASRAPERTETPSPVAPPAAPPAAPQPAETHTPTASVRIQVMSTPADAQLLLDDRHIANPFDAELPQSTAVHRLEARRAGYATVIQDLVLEFPQTVRMQLNRGRGVEDRRTHVSPNTGAAANAGAHAPEAPAQRVATPEPAAPHADAPAIPTSPPPAATATTTPTANPPAHAPEPAPAAPAPRETPAAPAHDPIVPPPQPLRSPF